MQLPFFIIARCVKERHTLLVWGIPIFFSHSTNTYIWFIVWGIINSCKDRIFCFSILSFTALFFYCFPYRLQSSLGIILEQFSTTNKLLSLYRLFSNQDWICKGFLLYVDQGHLLFLMSPNLKLNGSFLVISYSRVLPGFALFLNATFVHTGASVTLPTMYHSWHQDWKNAFTARLTSSGTYNR